MLLDVLALDVLPYDARCFFQKRAVLCGEGCGIVAVDVDLSDDIAADIDRDDNFRAGIDGAGEITWIGGYVVHDDRLAGSHGSAADALGHRYADVRCGRADEGAEDEHLGIVRIEHVEASPTEVRETLRHRGNDAGLQRFERRRRGGQIADVMEQAGPVRVKSIS
jgi:hypothetical protein